jgi:protoporphyrinogen oxidase
MKHVVVIGGGLTGLVAAERLAAGDISCRVVEREREAGGACRSIQRQGYIFDLTGHLLHVGQQVTEEYLRELGVWDAFSVYERKASVCVGSSYTPYPIQIHTHGLEPQARRDCLVGFVRAWASSHDEDPSNFAEWVLGRFGEGLARHFFFPYNSKLFRTDPEDLSLDWLGRYVPKPELEEVVDGALGLHDSEVGYNAVFRYPREGGICCLPEAVARRVPHLELGREVVAVNLKERWIELCNGERTEFGALVSTVSLPHFVNLLVGEVPEEITVARSELRWVRVLNLALGVRGEAPSTDHWVYFPDPELPFYRVGFPSNHGKVAPEGCHTVSIEVSLDPSGNDLETLTVDSEQALAAIGLLDRDRVEVRSVAVLDPSYVVFDHRRRWAVAKLRRFLTGHDVLISGRWAEWKYSAMEDAILDGMSVAKRLS